MMPTKSSTCCRQERPFANGGGTDSSTDSWSMPSILRRHPVDAAAASRHARNSRGGLPGVAQSMQILDREKTDVAQREAPLLTIIWHRC